MRSPALALLMFGIAGVVRAQTPSPAASSAARDTSLHVWATIALGPGTANGRQRLAGDIAVWFTRDRLAIWVRDATASRFLEAGDVWDVSVLAGIHPPSDAHVDFIAGAGLGMSGGHGTSGENLPRQPVVALGAQLNWNYRVVGIGIDGFATMSSEGRQYYGIGLALGVGAFRVR
jgi:hypothetical protein